MKFSKKHFSVIAACTAAAAAGIYGYIKGAGFLNGPRFRQQHDAVGRYVEARHPGASYAPITACPGGWHTVITDTNGEKYDLFINAARDGMYVYSEVKQ